jgi:hypothetical protein
VPTRDGNIISLKHVYTSWNRDGVTSRIVYDTHLPPFKAPGMKDLSALTDPSQILLIHTIFRELGYPSEPPFKVQYKKDITNEETWTDINLADQIKIASVMYYMKHKQRDENSREVEHRVIEENKLLVAISLERRTFGFVIKDTSSVPMKTIPSRFIMIDGAFELY